MPSYSPSMLTVYQEDLRKALRPSCHSIHFMYNLAILLRKANATKECGNDERELRCWGRFGKLYVTLD